MIQISNKYKMRQRDRNWQLMEWSEGGKTFRHPKTGEESITEGKWKPLEVYYENPIKMVRYVVGLGSAEISSNLRDFLDNYETFSVEYWNKVEKQFESK